MSGWSWTGRARRIPKTSPLQYEWRFASRPDGSAAAFDDPASAGTNFVADLAGTYEVVLTVSDGFHQAEASFSLRANRAPIADAGRGRGGQVATPMALDGTASVDPDGDPLTFQWRIVEAPEGSLATIEDADQEEARLVPDLPGTYDVELAVSDGHLESTARAVFFFTAWDSPGTGVFVAADGDDLARGDNHNPVATISAAFRILEIFPEVDRIMVYPGTYEVHETFHIDDRRVRIKGSSPRDITIRFEGDLFRLRDNGELVLEMLDIEGPGTVVDAAGPETWLYIDRLYCTARNCIESGRLGESEGGTVLIMNSEFTSADGQGTGVSVVGAESFEFKWSRVRGFAAGIVSHDTPTQVITNDVFDNADVGIWIEGAPDEVLVQGILATGNGTGLVLADVPDVTILRCTFEEGTTGVTLDGVGALLVDNAEFFDLTGQGLVMGANPQDGTEVVVRNTIFERIDGNAIEVQGIDTSLQLGVDVVYGGNTVQSSLVPLLDARPSGAPAPITVVRTTLNGTEPPPGTYTGPFSDYGMTIVESGNQIIVE